jgi:hypothetical protein
VNGEALAIAARLKIRQLADHILDIFMNTAAEGGGITYLLASEWRYRYQRMYLN